MRFLCAILAVAILTGFGFRAEAELVNGIDAIVHDSIITFQEVDDSSGRAALQVRQEYGNQPDVLRKKLADLYKENLEELQQRQLILHEFQTAGYNLPESIIDEQFEAYIKGKYSDRITFTKTLQQEGVTYEKARQDYNPCGQRLEILQKTRAVLLRLVFSLVPH